MSLDCLYAEKYLCQTKCNFQVMYLAKLLVLIGIMKLLNKEEKIFRHINLLFAYNQHNANGRGGSR